MNALVTIITGAGTGIGAATALELGRAGCPVHLLGRRLDKLTEVASEVGAAGGFAQAHACDVRDVDALRTLVDAIVEQHGRVDALVANAAVHDTHSVSDGDPAWWRELIDTNVLGVLYACHAVLPHMQSAKSGHLVIVSSVSGRVTYAGEPVYIASKHATVALGDSIRQAVAEDGIRVTLVEPGLVDTPMVDNPFANELKRRVHPLDAADCARAIRFALEQPAHCSINEIVLRPTSQVL
jgi:NADP-dependent 3-hydroxy acid dehydrogenase YdfG